MMTNFAMISGDRITFMHDLQKANGLPMRVPVDYWYSEWGFLIPLEANGTSILSYLNGHRDMELMCCGTVKAWMITPEGLLEEWLTKLDSTDIIVERRIVPMGPGVYGARSNDISVEEVLTAALEITEGDLGKSLEIAERTIRKGPGRVAELNISDIVKNINERFPLKGKRKGRGTRNRYVLDER